MCSFNFHHVILGGIQTGPFSVLCFNIWDYVLTQTEKQMQNECLPPYFSFLNRQTHLPISLAPRCGSQSAVIQHSSPRCATPRTNRDLDPPPEWPDGFTISTDSDSAGSAESSTLLRSWVTVRETD